MDIKAEVKDGKLCIEIPIDMQGRPSASGKTMVHATTGGNQATSAQVNGKPLIIGLNAYTRK